MTLCYSTSRQPAEPIISALGHELPGCEVQIRAVSLVIQRGPERQWDWYPVATTRFGTATQVAGDHPGKPSPSS